MASESLAGRVSIVELSGLLRRLLGIGDAVDLFGHPKVGASWEGFVIEQLVCLLENRDPTYWATHSGAEIDLRLMVGSSTLGFEIKRTDRPSTTRSMHTAIDDLGLDRLYVVHAGRDTFALAPKTTAIPAADLLAGGVDSLT